MEPLDNPEHVKARMGHLGRRCSYCDPSRNPVGYTTSVMGISRATDLGCLRSRHGLHGNPRCLPASGLVFQAGWVVLMAARMSERAYGLLVAVRRLHRLH